MDKECEQYEEWVTECICEMPPNHIMEDTFFCVAKMSTNLTYIEMNGFFVFLWGRHMWSQKNFG